MSASITLNALPDSVVMGETVLFTGTARRPDGSPMKGGYVTLWWKNRYTYLKKPDGGFVDGRTDSQGNYSITWTAWNQDGRMIGVQQFQALENNYVVFSNTRYMRLSEAPQPPPPPPPPADNRLSWVIVGLTFFGFLAIVTYAAWSASQ